MRYYPTPKEFQVIDSAPDALGPLLRKMLESNERRGAIRELESREYELGGKLQAWLSAMLMDPNCREVANSYWDKTWSQNKLGVPERHGEIIVGSGLHAAAYCAARAEKARRERRIFIPPLVLEQGERVGGVFAMSKKPSFYLNSRNRPGSPGTPGDVGSLNNIPFAPLQVSAIAGAEYLANTEMADIIRLTLASYARVVTGIKVTNLNVRSFASSRTEEKTVGLYRKDQGDRSVLLGITNRVIITNGLGEPCSVFTPSDGSPNSNQGRLMPYHIFMARMDQTFPLRDMRRVAVIGAGDSGRTAVEVLLGQGPQAGWSSAALDWVQRIDWYGVGSRMTEQTWCENNRGRYRNIGRGFRSTTNGQRLVGKGKAEFVNLTPEGVQINGVVYDHVIDATGFRAQRLTIDEDPDDQGARVPCILDGQRVGRQEPSQPIYYLGPTAALAKTNGENSVPALDKIPANLAAIWRYASRTASAALSFPVDR